MEYKVAVITGASTGIGKAIAESFAEKGIRLVLIARRKDKLEELGERLGGLTKCLPVGCDVTDTKDLEKNIKSLPEEFREVDILVNNAGLALGLDAVQNIDWKDWERMINTNCTALAFITHLLAGGMVKRNRGHIVNIGSIAGTYPYFGGNVYGATKAFVKQFSINLKTDLMGTAVRITNIEPGMVEGSEFSLVRFKGDSKKADKVYEGTKALGPEDIAKCVSWVVSLPPHVNINRIEVMPVAQAPAGVTCHRKDAK
jgi:NADP-dependent 3-hydroxy acid dehydrogenase YdfG